MPNLHVWTLTARAFVELARHDILIRTKGFRAIHSALRRMPVSESAPHSRFGPMDIAEAVATASLLYFKRVRCLQYAAAAARLLRRHGYAARFVIGYRPIPFVAHAWVEVGDHIFSTEQSLDGRRFQVLDRV